MTVVTGASVLVHLTSCTCSECGITFGMPDWYQQKRREDRQTFYCPNGHTLSYHTSRVQQLENALARERAANDQIRADRDHIRNQRNAMKGQVTKLKRRAAAGVCPCCNRQFQELAKHMANKHPEFVEDAKSE